MILQSCDWFFRKGFLNKTVRWFLTLALFLSTAYIDVGNRCLPRYVLVFFSSFYRIAFPQVSLSWRRTVNFCVTIHYGYRRKTVKNTTMKYLKIKNGQMECMKVFFFCTTAGLEQNECED
jgi:hypothetical protein